MDKKTTALSVLLVCLGCTIFSYAEETLDEILISTENTTNKIPTTEKKTEKIIQNELIRDTKDLVRYSPDVGIVDNGRFIKGFSMRGVEGNRVGISIDGVNLPDSEENTLYARYGNFNSSRLSIDTELINNIDIVKGADSFHSGSGALGGTVNYQTLEPQDLVLAENRFGALLRTGYASKNKEWVRTFGVGYVGQQVDALLLYSQRTGHELKSNGRGEIDQSSSSQHPDPSTHRYHSYLAKLGIQLNDHHKIGIGINGQQGHRYTDERSYALFGGQWREADDQNKRLNLNLYYLYTPQSEYLAFTKFDVDYQKTDLAAVNYKGGRHWQTDEKELDEVFDRRMKTTFKRASFYVESEPLSFLGSHILGLKMAASERQFENINHDTNRFGLDSHYTIQYPIKTKQYRLALKDNVTWFPTFDQWTPKIMAHLGAGYDYTKYNPQRLNAPCSTACLAEGAPQKSHFANWSGLAGIDAQVTDNWTFGYLLTTGYRLPTATERYFTFTNAYGKWKSNPALKAEKSLNHTFFAKGEGKAGLLDVMFYQNHYRNFLFEQESIIEETAYGRTFQSQMQKMVNVDKAKIHGIEIKGRLNLAQLLPAPEGLTLFGALGYSKGHLSNNASLLSIQPMKMVIGIDYEHPQGKWGIFSRLTYLANKKAKDAQVFENKTRCVRWEYDYWYDRDMCVKDELYQTIDTYKYLNKSAYVFDLFGYYKINQHITLRAGIYNLFNRRYQTWDALRGINANSTTNTVDRDGLGLERFYAPGRNYSASIEVRF
ncbi:TonB-dependent hemoglobin/transferrin/lactoferrin family receptor [Avibacterium sp. 20-129]|uniref:TonB-dependent hemoglobin/transferrin/lactoferrin family receptor n=1 Tax=Avibacterium sp. 20-129 TaxID=2911525 RepID=UPI002245257E|nr:TonB-dependent hemoglobin/transferrin/lactoferrin family receptor [Avibacterium sp. 20-129]MCW9699182.1 TonB-dependent hemoglobin/transferrin/lactoferrin family receptor [Avibacterium sp. 20-129]